MAPTPRGIVMDRAHSRIGDTDRCVFQLRVSGAADRLSFRCRRTPMTRRGTQAPTLGSRCRARPICCTRCVPHRDWEDISNEYALGHEGVCFNFRSQRRHRCQTQIASYGARRHRPQRSVLSRTATRTPPVRGRDILCEWHERVNTVNLLGPGCLQSDVRGTRGCCQGHPEF